MEQSRDGNLEDLQIQRCDQNGVSPNVHAETPLILRAKRLQTANSLIIKNLIDLAINNANSGSFGTDAKISSSFTINDSVGKQTVRKNVQQFMQNAIKEIRREDSSYSISQSKVRKLGTSYLVNGIVSFGQSVEKGDKILYENQFSYTSGDWILESTKIKLEK